MRINIWLISLLVALAFTSCKKKKIDDDKNDEITDAWDTVRMNKIQVLASHNSYRTKTYQPIFDYVQSIKAILPSEYNPDGWDYTHLPFDKQFSNYGIRSLEIDIYYDPNGGRYYNRGGLSLVSEPTESGIAELQQPGYKVLHIPDLDYETNYYTFKKALQAVKDWSDANPRHLPITIYVETKLQTAGDVIPLSGFVKSIPYTLSAADELDAEVKAVFGSNLDKVITPDKLRGNYATLNEAVLADNWHQLKDARGKILFVMEGGLMSFYRQGKQSLEGRTMFVFANPNESDAAFVIRNTAPGNETSIANLVKQGYMVRTRADGDTKEARTGDYSRANAAFNSGAQIVSTDYYKPDYRCNTSSEFTCYKVELPDGKIGRISPAFANEISIDAELKE